MTLHNWKKILENWINCYSNSKQEVEIQSLLNIISYLRENLCLDDSKSSLVESQTLEEFIQEKFPSVVFDNVGVDSNENELYIVASLLLFFVCVNSKDINIKNAMCNKLSVSDQETIMKFTKVLMETAVITCKDVQHAISEACNSPAASVEQCTTVAETPPAIRNMHSEVRRLQAALDAERFDKNFLQEELSRTNHKFEKLLQDKEQYKLDILALKAKISNCCGQESDRHTSNVTEHNASVKLLRQLEEMEERLVDTQTQLEEAVHERNIYKAKVEELKVERNKWINTSQEECSRAAALSQQLEVERHNNELLKELVADLRQHNDHNVVDTSQLECDDPDVSLQSIGRNMSVCNEVCANVVEVQLREERDKIVVLQQQINLLQEKVKQVEQSASEDKTTLLELISRKDEEIESLKQTIKEEVEKQINLEKSLTNDVAMLNNRINELGQTIKEKQEVVNRDQEEKMLLLEKVNVLKNKVKDMETENEVLRTEINKNKNSVVVIQENYKDVVKKWNEKVQLLNLGLDKWLYSSKKSTHRDVKEKINEHCNLVTKEHLEMTQHDDDKIACCGDSNDANAVVEVQIIEEFQDFEQQIKSLEEKVKHVEQSANEDKTTLLELISLKDNEMESLKQTIKEEVEKQIRLEKSLTNDVTILNNRINELGQTIKENQEVANRDQEEKMLLLEKINVLKNELNDMEKENEELRIEVNEKKNSEVLMQENYKVVVKKLNEKVQLLNVELDKWLHSSKESGDVNEKINEHCNLVLNEPGEMTQHDDNKIACCGDSNINAVVEIQMNLESDDLKQDIESLQNKLKQCRQIADKDKVTLKELLSSKDAEIEELKYQVKAELEKYISLKESLNDEIRKLHSDISDYEVNLNDCKQLAYKELNQKVEEISKLQEDKLTLLKSLTDRIDGLECENLRLKNDLIEDQNSKLKMQDDYESHITTEKEKVKQVEQSASEDKATLLELISRKDEEIESLKQTIKEEVEKQINLEKSLTNDVAMLNNRINELGQTIKEKQEVVNRDQEEKMLLLEKVNVLKNKVKDMETENEVLRTEINKNKNSVVIIQENYKDVVKKWNEKVQLLNLGLDKWLYSSKKSTHRDVKEKINEHCNLVTKEHLEMTQHDDDKIACCGDSNDANAVVEVQIIEEFQDFEQQIKSLEEKVKHVEQSANEDKTTLLELISLKDNEMESLKQTIKEEVEKQIRLEKSLTNDVTILNNRINELGQTIKENQEVANRDQEEKMLLLEKINVLKNELNDMEKENEELRIEVNEKKNSEVLMQENYKVVVKKLNEKVQLLNVELDKWLHSSKESGDVNEKINEHCNLVLNESGEMTQHDDNKIACCGDSNINAVVEIQMNLESDDLKQDIESLQNKLKQCRQIADKDKVTLKELLSSKDAEIEELKYQVKAELEKYISLKESLNDEIRKLHSDISDYEVNLNDCKQLAYKELNQKVEEISKLQEDKLTLLKSLTDRIDGLECENLRLKNDLIEDQNSKLKMQDDYESHITTEKEKVKQVEQSASEDKATLLELISRKDEEIESLKQTIKEEVEKQINLEKSLTNDVAMLNNRINELGQTIKEKQEVVNRDQEEKMLLLEKVNVLKNKVKDMETENEVLRTEINKNKNSVVIIQENYKDVVKKWNEKVQLLNLGLDKWLYSSKKSTHRDVKEKINEHCNLVTKEHLEMTQHDDDKIACCGDSNDANAVVEVQIIEEFQDFEQQIKSLEEKVKHVEQSANEDKTTLLELISLKDKEMESLKQTIKEEVEKQIRLEKSLTNDVTILNNRINELGQTIKENQEVANRDQEEKMLLLEKINVLKNELNDMEKENEELRTEVNENKNLEVLMQENYKVVVKKLNEKVQLLNVELDKWLHSSKESGDVNEKINEHCNLVLNEPGEMTQHDDNKIACCGDSNINAVVEIQMNLESDDLKQDIESLQNKLKQCRQIADKDKVTLKKLLSSKDAEIEELKYQVKAELEKYLSLKESLNDDIRKLHSDISDYEVNLNDCKQLAYKELNQKVEEISKLQEDKLTLLKSLTDRIDGLECENLRLKNDLNEDQNSKLKMQDDYESHITTEKEKVKQVEQSASEDKVTLLELISRKDEEIESLKQTIIDEVENKIHLEKSLTNDVAMLNNRINELGQTIKEKQEVVNRDQEEKMLLLEKVNVLKNKVKDMETENEELRTEINRNKNSEVIIQDNYKVTVKQWNAKVQSLNVELDKWLHSSNESRTDVNEKIIQQCNFVLKEPVEMTQNDSDKIASCGDSNINAVVEVQMNQESDDFKQQLESLENKLKQYQQIANRDKVTLKELLSSKDAEIAKLKCQVRAEIEKYISLKESLNDEIKRLHSDISYYEVKLNDCEQLAYKELNQKVKDISTLQEDKLTLLKSLTDRIDGLEEKLETVECENHRLKNDLHKEQDSKLKMQDDYESHITKLNEKISKMSVTENRASQIIKVSAKYQAIILKRVAEIKSNTVLKELTNFGNIPCDNEVRRSLNAGSITMEELESFLETTDKHLRKCSEKQSVLQKERDRLASVIKINESEIINMKKYLTELSVYFKTFNSVKQVYNQKLSQVVSQQRMVRREILNLEERLSESALAKLERGYASVLQDLTECAMSFERWVERCISRTVSPEKISLTFTSEHASLAGGNFQNSSLESQLDEIEKGFQRLLLDISRAQRGEGSKDAQTMTILEVKAEYEDKLDRMKAKMKQIYQEQTTIFREKQREEVASLERQLQHAREKLVESSRAYEEHIRGLTSELWNVGEKFLIEKNEADWLKRKCISGSLMSLQQVHSSGLGPPRADKPRPSDTYSLRSLPLHNKSEARTLHMSDEEGEVFDNRWLKELSATPRTRRSPQIGGEPRLSELRYRNSLCPPHLKSSYPAETQFAPTVGEEDIKYSGIGGRQRKEVGITAYKKPGPPTPSKQAGRLSATDSELREGLRLEPDMSAPRKTSTPSRIRALFRSSKTLTDNTASPRRRLSIFRNKK